MNLLKVFGYRGLHWAGWARAGRTACFATALLRHCPRPRVRPGAVTAVRLQDDDRGGWDRFPLPLLSLAGVGLAH
jgi:hypothetical protein